MKFVTDVHMALETVIGYEIGARQAKPQVIDSFKVKLNKMSRTENCDSGSHAYPR